MKATFIQKAWNEKDGYNSPVYEYEYRGRKYYVTDHRNGYSETMRDQHGAEQNRIDTIIDQENRNSSTKPVDWEEIWAMINGKYEEEKQGIQSRS